MIPKGYQKLFGEKISNIIKVSMTVIGFNSPEIIWIFFFKSYFKFQKAISYMRLADFFFKFWSLNIYKKGRLPVLSIFIFFLAVIIKFSKSHNAI